MERATLDNSRYSDPMPVIGLYIAGATLVCFLLMLCDIFNGIRHSKPWMPCRFFKLNSFSLTLLSIATKIPVDLTTSMPSAYDQLSKLCGSCFICISVGFVHPSIGNVSASEFPANKASLTIMVVTVIVNISIQMTTGVIFLFKVEHVITLVSMLLLLGMTCASDTKGSSVEIGTIQQTIKDKRENYTKALLKNCYIFGYMVNPQLCTYKSINNASIGILCTFCLVALSEAAIQTFRLEGLKLLIRKEVSDYKWSIWAVLAIQFLTIIVGALAVACRWIALASQVIHTALRTLRYFRRLKFINVCQLLMLVDKNWELYFQFLSFPRGIFQIFQLLESISFYVLFTIRIWATFIDFFGDFVVTVSIDCLAWAMRKTGFCFGFQKCYDGVNQEIVASLRKEVESMTMKPIAERHFSDNLLWKCKMDIERFIKKHSAQPTTFLVQFLGRSTSIQHPVLFQQINEGSNKLLLLVCLVRIVEAIVPSARSGSMVSSFDEIFEIIVFIHGKTQPTEHVHSNICINVAKDIWIRRGSSSHWFHNSFVKHLINGADTGDPSSSSLVQALEILDTYSPLRWFGLQELFDVKEIIYGNDPATSLEEDVYSRMERLFVELLNWYIDQFPNAVINSLLEPFTVDQFEENAKLCLKYVSTLGRLEVNWGCIGTRIGSFMTTDDYPSDAPNHEAHHGLGGNVVSDDTSSFPTAQEHHLEIVEQV